MSGHLCWLRGRVLLCVFLKQHMVSSWMLGFPGGTRGKEPACQCQRHKRHGFNPWVEKIPWTGAWQPTPVFLPGESHGQRSLADYSPWGCKESDTSEVTEHARVCLDEQDTARRREAVSTAEVKAVPGRGPCWTPWALSWAGGWVGGWSRCRERRKQGERGLGVPPCLEESV